MKKQFLMLMSTLVFAVLMYRQELGLNLSLFGLFLLSVNVFLYKDRWKDKKACLLACCVVITCVSNAWLTTFVTFISVVISSFVMRYYLADSRLKLLTQAFVFITNWFAAFIQFLQFNTWLDIKSNTPKHTIAKLLSFIVVPVVIVSVFLSIYISSSDYLSTIYQRYELNIDFECIVILTLGFYISFVFWHAKIYGVVTTLNRALKTDFGSKEQKNVSSTFDFWDIDFEKKSGEITLMALNILLFLFILLFNYEHFQPASFSYADLSNKIHEQIFSLIGAIFLAIVVLLFYFKGALNFVKNNKKILLMAKIWLILNSLLVLSAAVQNTVYVCVLGLTYKRLGVYLFLSLCGIGLYYAFRKINHKKNTFFLINKMSWAVFFSLIFCSAFNWGSLITQYNLSLEEKDYHYVTEYIEGNEKALLTYYKTYHPENIEEIKRLTEKVKSKTEKPLLSSSLYYYTIDIQ